ncbi:hypothetical protein [Megamonas funiformis]|nr:hypothetical protein [Megamonas funiformis]
MEIYTEEMLVVFVQLLLIFIDKEFIHMYIDKEVFVQLLLIFIPNNIRIY